MVLHELQPAVWLGQLCQDLVEQPRHAVQVRLLKEPDAMDLQHHTKQTGTLTLGMSHLISLLCQGPKFTIYT